MVRGKFYTIMVRVTKGNGKMEKCTGLGHIIGPIPRAMKESMKRESNMEREDLKQKMERYMTGAGKTECGMEME